MDISNTNHLLTVNHNGCTYVGADAVDYVGTLLESNKHLLNQENEWFSTSRYTPFTYSLLTPNAVAPCKTRDSDSGFDLNLIDVKKTFGKVKLYGTGVSVTPPSGFYFDLVPRSSMIKSGYMLANSVGIIDQGYTGEIMVALVQVDPDAEPLKLPCKLVQLVPRKWYGLKPVIGSLPESSRGDGGFGSTGN